ncbi:MAG: hypothetical protein NVS4B9_31100 [Ktedonobacteraceae bacterium]
MDKQILLCIDATFSPATQSVVRAVVELVQQTGSTFSFILLHSIPATQVIAGQPGYYIEQQIMFTPSVEQRKQAEVALHEARTMLLRYGVSAGRIEDIVRIGAVADEVVQVARERRVLLIAVGSRGMSFRQQVRRFFLGSISRRILQLAPCPVMIVAAPPAPPPLQNKDLIPWYEDAVRTYLAEHRHELTILTTQEVARQFLPPDKKTPGRQERAAAAIALDHLANAGLLCRRDVAGEIRYVND